MGLDGSPWQEASKMQATLERISMSANCTCGEDYRRQGKADPYCRIHGRIRDMDHGASPFVDTDALEEEIMRDLDFDNDEIARVRHIAHHTAGPTPLEQQLRREAQEADARGAQPFPTGLYDREVGTQFDAESTAEEITDEDD